MESATITKAAQLLAKIIDEGRSEIERRWLEQVQRDVCKTPGLALTQLRDGMPDYLAALADFLHRTGATAVEESAHEAWSVIAREHGITRVRIGFDISQLLREFVVLRHVIRDVAEEHDILLHGPDSLLVDILDAAISAAVQAYVAARDYDARRRQAEHIGFLTHELRNPLAAAVAAAWQLRRQATPEQLKLLDVLDRGHRRLSNLIDSVLLTQKLEAGKVKSRPSEVTLGQIIEGALEGARLVAEQKGLVFKASYDPDIEVRIDPLLTRSAIENIADNAVKYTDSGTVAVTVEDRGDQFEVHLRDSCQGLSPEELATIFEPFERGASSKSGTGLGLAIARRAVEAQEGSIRVESRETSGCHFWITLPKRARAETK